MLKIENVTMRFGRKVALDGVSLELGAGVYGLLGPNGSGKTTLMRCITGILRPKAGSITAPDRIGYLPQKFGMFKQLRVYETLEYFAELKKIPKGQQKEMILGCLEAVNLSDRVHDKIGSLSGGMVRRVGLAQALLGDPEVIILDEPTAGLDPEERLRFHNLVARIEKYKTVIISTHIVEDVASACDHIVILDLGKVVTESTAEELRANAEGMVWVVPTDKRSELAEPYVLLREDAIENTLRILSAKPQPGELVPPTVEDGYMRYIRGER